MSRVVLVTGVSRDLGARFARTLAASPDVVVIGVDVVPPRFDIGEARYVRADIRNAAISRVITAEQVDTVVHLGMIATPNGPGGRSVMKEINVIGTMQLLAACQRAPSVHRLVVQSSAAVYGASPRDPARFTEDMNARVQPRSGFAKDAIEIESYVRGLARRRSDLVVSTLRLASRLGAGVDSWLTRYLTLPVVPRPMGYDARLQFLHPTDAVRALLAATERDLPGTFNVAADDVVTLGLVLAAVGNPAMPLPAGWAPSLSGIARQARAVDLTADQIAALTYGRVMDTSRFRAVGFEPEISSRAALDEFAAAARPGPLHRTRVSTVLDRAAALAGRTVDRVAALAGERGSRG
ncbi:NAD-dependent epimerase/dehydratase family protein [Microlunatus soli]|uniref:UDP-glucose 4-epimerase n=1 Tax=Microlunatus soli TaxID=630515 RepID=A0A1H1SE41_9ACTN|nr:NAD-dependent epimerase/dehydratase family protein [Microlunatus soli]SDS45629.1 UDP-glucose 4-epimerase [Microlunatus soli]